MNISGRMIIAAASLWLAMLGVASAQSFPSRPMTMIIPFAAGGPTDVKFSSNPNAGR